MPSISSRTAIRASKLVSSPALDLASRQQSRQQPRLPSAQHFWTPSRVKTLIAEWNDGLSAGVICKHFGCTRNAVVGKVSRLRNKGVELADHDPDRRGKTLKRGRKKSTSAPKRQPRAPANPFFTPDIMRRARELAASGDFKMHEAVGPGVSLLDVEAHHCRWPKGDPKSKEFIFCGSQKVPGLPYCPSCAPHAYNHLTPLQLAAMHVVCQEMEAARADGRSSPFQDPKAALKDFQDSLAEAPSKQLA